MSNSALLLVSASGLAREAAVAAAAAGFEVRGFLDDDTSQWGTSREGVPVLGGLDLVAEHPDAGVVICTGQGRVRAAIAGRLAADGLDAGRYATVIHPSVAVPESCTVGAGSILLANTVLTTAVTIGRHCVVMPQVTLTHDNVLADFVTIAAGVSLGGWTRVGERGYLGMNASVRERVSLAADVTIGMGAVVLTDAPPGSTLVGNPARPLVRG
ncbi:MAG TPA: NeuD/PglB/VioB family sugar acetyltransferase [Jatrophihabitans sp.]|nr:NeuD/PglB/VioB family sugar acetyltransferase [Jatrophihabitans sp.]